MQVEELRARFGPNEVKTKQTPEWKKIARRFADWICILIVRRPTPSASLVPTSGRRSRRSAPLPLHEDDARG
jgi:Cation transporter/ATPase, N-terminus